MRATGVGQKNPAKQYLVLVSNYKINNYIKINHNNTCNNRSNNNDEKNPQ